MFLLSTLTRAAIVVCAFVLVLPFARMPAGDWLDLRLASVCTDHRVARIYVRVRLAVGPFGVVASLPTPALLPCPDPAARGVPARPGIGHAKDFLASPPLIYIEGIASRLTMGAHADKKLAKRLIDGDSASFDVFFNTYYPRLYRFAMARLDGDADLSDDTAQAVLCQALSSMSTYRGEAPLFSWLCTFCRYEVSRQRRSRRRAQGDTTFTEDDPSVRAALESLLSVSGDDPDVRRYQSELTRLVQVTLDNLPSLYADALESKYVHGRSVHDIARLLGKSDKATESVLSRARRAFKDSFLALVQAGDGGLETVI